MVLMFNESWPWKCDLWRSVQRLRKEQFELARKLDRVDDEADLLYSVERDVMFGCFAVRRLIWMPSKVTKEARKAKVTVIQYPKITAAPTLNVWEALGELDMFDYDAPQTISITVNAMCNLFIHSLIFRFAWTLRGVAWGDWDGCNTSEENPDELAGFLVASDKDANRVLTFVPLDEIIRLFLILVDDEVVGLCGKRGKDGRMHLTTHGPGELECSQIVHPVTQDDGQHNTNNAGDEREDVDDDC